MIRKIFLSAFFISKFFSITIPDGSVCTGTSIELSDSSGNPILIKAKKISIKNGICYLDDVKIDHLCGEFVAQNACFNTKTMLCEFFKDVKFKSKNIEVSTEKLNSKVEDKEVFNDSETKICLNKNILITSNGIVYNREKMKLFLLKKVHVTIK